MHKIDRLARNMEDHVAIRAAFRRAGVTLVSVTENLDGTASGKLVEGIHALMAEFYSANLATEIRKGMRQKAKFGGWPDRASIGYLNTREIIDGRYVARIVPDPDRAPLVTLAFELYATGDYTLHQLADELDRRGLRSRSNTRRPLSLNGISTMLHNPAYIGICDALDAAVATRGRRHMDGVIMHTDRGSELGRVHRHLSAARGTQVDGPHRVAPRQRTRGELSRRSRSRWSIVVGSRPAPRHGRRSSAGSPNTTSADCTRPTTTYHRSSGNTDTRSTTR